jgi:hypothetical protein
MAKQNGIIKLKGTIGDIAFYKSKDGHLAREKGGVTAERIKGDAAFQRTRENMSEFARAGSTGKLIRMAFRTYLVNLSDNRMTSRLLKAMMTVIKADATSTRGERNVLDGELELLTGFEFNNNANLVSAFYAPYTSTVDRVTGAMQIDIPAFVPGDMIAAPEGTTHCRLIGAGASIDFEIGTYELATSQSEFIPIAPNEVPALKLLNQIAANSTHPLFLALGIEFYQQVNGLNYPLKNGSYNSLAFVRVLGI